MIPEEIIQSKAHNPVNKAFSLQSDHFDEEDTSNPILQDLRQQVYEHVTRFIKPRSNILELNAGTGIDAWYLVKQGHIVHATDLSDGMIAQIEKKIAKHNLSPRLTCQQLSYDQLDKVNGEEFDYVFSNFGGLNCIQDLAKVTKHLPAALKPGAYITWVVMPPVCVWEIAGALKGNFSQAFRRFHKDGVMAHLEGQYFKTYYHPLHEIKKAFGPSFRFVNSEGLAALTPPPHQYKFPVNYPGFYKTLRRTDALVRSRFPFNRWADHIIVTFQYRADTER